jgi:hypothetical protein
MSRKPARIPREIAADIPDPPDLTPEEAEELLLYNMREEMGDEINMMDFPEPDIIP